MKEKKNRYNAFLRQLSFLAVLVTIGLIIVHQLNFFVGSFLGAITIYVVLRGILFTMTEKWNWRPWLAALMLVIANSLILLILSFMVVKVTAAEIPNIDTSQIVAQFNLFLDNVNQTVGFKIVPQDIFEKTEGVIARLISSIINTTYSFTANILMMLVILFFMLVGGRRMEAKILEFSPFSGKSLSLLKTEVKNMIFSNAVGIPVVMIAQAIVSTLIYWILGINDFFFWGFLTAICGLMPLVGTAIVWVPLGIFLFATGNLWQGVVLLIYGVAVITTVDNLCRIVLTKTVSNTHPLIVIFGVILGIPLFGFWGIIFGPLLISGFILLIRIYFTEYGIAEQPKPQKEIPPQLEPKQNVFKVSDS